MQFLRYQPLANGNPIKEPEALRGVPQFRQTIREKTSVGDNKTTKKNGIANHIEILTTQMPIKSAVQITVIHATWFFLNGVRPLNLCIK
jgi:hypothetical protein